jgi:AmmeMemoRadiSam system protein A
LDTGRQLKVDTKASAPEVTADGASFVSLDKDGKLRGCIGSIGAHRPLIIDVAENAFRAAFKDSRFKPLVSDEIAKHEIVLTVSVLSPQAPINFTDETDLVSQLRPGTDGVVLQEGGRRGVFLPVVWESLPEPAKFLRNLKRKAGLSEDYWSDSLLAWRYVTETVSSEALPDPRAIWTD